MLTFLNRIFVGPFYARNAGTFLVIILLAFGFLSAREHKALITACLGSWFLLALVFVLWGFYLVKVSSFVRQELVAPEHLFLQTLWLVPTPSRYALWLAIQIGLLAPVIAYGSWMIQLATVYEKWDSLTAIVAYLFCLIGVGAYLNDYRLRHPGPDTLRIPHLQLKLPYELFFPVYWLRHEPLSLVLTKAFSGLLLAGVCRLYPTDDYDQRLLLIGLLLAILGHAQVGGQVSAFEKKYLLLLPNLPFTWWQRLVRYGLTYGLIWLPELLILGRNYPAEIQPDYVIWLWLTGWGWLLLLHSLAYGYDILPERWLSGIFGGFIGGLLLIMFGVPVGAWLIIGWVSAVGIWYRTFPL
ncbi:MULTISPECIES: hypothetical protein [unclassified Spirosoma]|uniref:hypothetical protein n=1 Tax=unclassified Spirosoma TaxID=2621999 RepID=UPI00095A23E1|nr:MULTISPECIES: hypothetical protein [unclassified Spirosoma]MBN8821583.1 hypothetical protein [Spirosoma sp.]OJW78354.1 MAG: hypothetical protein BGO59_30580 [Spirosoma sp. 48-14]